MNITKKIKSWEGNKDCFGIGEPSNVDHIYPVSLGGSNNQNNKQKISQYANEKKGDKTKGYINDEWRFSIIMKVNKEQELIGTMYIRKKDWQNDVWWEFIPVK